MDIEGWLWFSKLILTNLLKNRHHKKEASKKFKNIVSMYLIFDLQTIENPGLRQYKSTSNTSLPLLEVEGNLNLK